MNEPRVGEFSPAMRQNSRLRIAFIGGRGVGGAYSGIERYYEEIGGRLAERGHRVVAYSRSHFSPKGPEYRGMEVRRIPTIRSKHFETFFHSLLCTLDVCFRHVDIVQFHALGSSPFSWLPRVFGKKAVVSVRGLDWQRAKWGFVARTYLRLCETTSLFCPNATVVVSKTLREYFEKRFGKKVFYIPNGVGTPAPTGSSCLSRWDLQPRRYFLYAGRLSPEKRLETLIRAHAGLEGDCPLVIAGGSSYSEGYIHRIREMAGPRVVFTGFVKGRIMAELYGNALAFVLPSEMEGLSVALLEAMSHGLAVIASDIPENREVIHECGGFLFPLGDELALAAVMRRLLREPGFARESGIESEEKVRRKFGWASIALETEAFYHRLLSGSRSRTVGSHVQSS